MKELRANYNNKPVLTEEQETEWKLQLANAILAESEIKVGDKIEHQCGTVWAGKFALSAMESEEENENTPL